MLWSSLPLWRSGNDLLSSIPRFAAYLALLLLVAWIVMVSFWPWAQVSPLVNPLRGIRNAARYTFLPTTLFYGHQVPSHPAPPSYLPTWFGLQLPEFYLVAAVAAMIGYGVRRREAAVEDPGSRMALGFLTFVVLFPLATAIIARSTLYDGVRHFLFLIPPLAVFAAAGTEHGLRPAIPRAVRVLLAGSLVATFAVTACDMVALHPYESVYFNRLVAGGLPGAAGRFETDYWGNSYREATEWVMRSLPGNRIRIAGCSDPLQWATTCVDPSARVLFRCRSTRSPIS